MKERMITAVILIAIALPIIMIGGIPFIILGVSFSLVAMYEMIQMRETVKKAPLEVKILSMLATLGIVFHAFDFHHFKFQDHATFGFETIVLIFILLFSLMVVRQSFKLQDVGYYMAAILYVGATFRSMLFLRTQGINLFVFVFVVVALTDSFAYFVGRKFGKHKLAPLISPKKTVEGSIGGTVAGVVAGVVYGLLTNLTDSVLTLVFLSLILAIVGQLGDLVASSMKREYKIKDYGKIFPGHGGVLDRLDSSLYASLALYLVMTLLNVVIY